MRIETITLRFIVSGQSDKHPNNSIHCIMLRPSVKLTNKEIEWIVTIANKKVIGRLIYKFKKYSTEYTSMTAAFLLISINEIKFSKTR